MVADVAQIVGNDAEANPALHTAKTFVAGPLQDVTPLQDADPPFAPRAPFLQVLELSNAK